MKTSQTLSRSLLAAAFLVTIPMASVAQTSPAHDVVSPTTTPAPANGTAALASGPNTMIGHLTIAKTEFKKMLDALKKVPDAAHGGFAAKAIVDVQTTLADIDKSIDYVKAHPEVNPLQTGPFLGLHPDPSLPKVASPPAMPRYADIVLRAPKGSDVFFMRTDSGKAVNQDMVSAFVFAGTAYAQFMPIHEGPVPQVVDIGGNRYIVMGDIIKAMTNIVAGIDYAHNQIALPSTPIPATASTVSK